MIQDYLSTEGTYTATGKALSSDIARFMLKAYPSSFDSVEAAEKFWDEMMGFVSASIVAGHAVVLRGIGTLRPYVKKGGKCHHPSLKRKIKVPTRWNLRLGIHPWMRKQLRAQEVPANAPIGAIKRRVPVAA